MASDEPIRRAWFATTDPFWPRSCRICATRLHDPSDVCLCRPCVSVLTTDPHVTCPRCSSTVGPHTDLSSGCPRCRNERYRFQSVTRLGVNGGELRAAILDIKRPGGEELAEDLGTLFAATRGGLVLGSQPQVVVPVPLHWTRWWTRRHNPAEGIARGLANRLGLPLNTRAIRRVRSTPRQATATPTERRKNLIGAFRPTRLPGLLGLRVLLVDDVLTTGATADATTEAVYAAGAAQVDVAVLAHR